ncbi:hypothetical protein G7070_09845 [Propioniciclava coleopterorum]|uniref:Uncharacterized protein n=1 Tax=Propioniciclava coleopterorum TaxID=2714937 RepID=A0A6G7Y6S6_9ACTN|nr:hypothetical protein [Propioniciclava coleopterorum]QIK72515.1 hypothetical protein G7070_09845 [Propioniciclava coleopterorum]
MSHIQISRRSAVRGVAAVAAAVLLSGCAAMVDPEAAAPSLWVREPEYDAEVVTAVGADVARAAWEFSVDFALTHQFREELMDPERRPTSEALISPVIGQLTPLAQQYWRDEVDRALRGEPVARENLDVLMFSGWEADAEIQKPARGQVVTSQAIERGRVGLEGETGLISVRFAYRAGLEMAARGHPVTFAARNEPVHYLERQTDGTFRIARYSGRLDVKQS